MSYRSIFSKYSANTNCTRILYTNSKQGISATVFSWVFMTIIGGILLMFTYSILESYWSIETQRNNIEFSKSLTNSLEVYAFNPSPQSATVFNTYPILANKNLQLSCIEEQFTRLEIDGSQLSYQPLNNILDQHPVMMSRLDNEIPNSIYLIQEDFSFPMSITSLIGIVPKGHIIVINESSTMHEITRSLLNTKRSYRQLSFYIWEDSTLSDSEKVFEINELNPSSISFIGFDTSHVQTIIDTHYSSSRINVYGIDHNFNRAPSYYDPSNEKRIVLGNLSYTYSNNEQHYQYTNQNNANNPREFNFAHLNDDISLATFSMFTPPPIFSCAYSSLKSQSEFVYELKKNKVETILNSPGDLNTTYCQSNSNNLALEQYYEIINVSLHELYSNSTHNFFNSLTESSINSNIAQIEGVQKDLINNYCELIY